MSGNKKDAPESNSDGPVLWPNKSMQVRLWYAKVWEEQMLERYGDDERFRKRVQTAMDAFEY